MTANDKLHIQTVIADAIQKNVNGKVDSIKAMMVDHVETHKINDDKVNKALARIEPYIQAAEDERKFNATIQEKGKQVIWFAAFCSAVGSLYFVVRQILK